MDFVASSKDSETMDETEIYSTEARELKLERFMYRIEKLWADAHERKYVGL